MGDGPFSPAKEKGARILFTGLSYMKQIYPFKKKYYLPGFFILLIFILWNQSLWAEERISDILIKKSQGQLKVHFKVEDCFSDDMKKAIENGIETSFTFFIIFYEVSSFWMDKKLTALEVSHTIRYDNFRKQYKIRLLENADQPERSTDDFMVAKKWMAEVNGIPIIDNSLLKKGASYKIQIMAELDKIRLPFYLHYIFFFLSLWDFETDWYSFYFTY